MEYLSGLAAEGVQRLRGVGEFPGVVGSEEVHPSASASQEPFEFDELDEEVFLVPPEV